MKKFSLIIIAFVFIVFPAKAFSANDYSVYIAFGVGGLGWVIDGYDLNEEPGVESGDSIHGFIKNGRMIIKSNSGNRFYFPSRPGSRFNFSAPVPSDYCVGVGTSEISCQKLNRGPESLSPRLTGPARFEVNDIGCGANETGVFLSSINDDFQTGYLINSSGSSHKDYIYSGGVVDGCGGNDVIKGSGKIYGGPGNDNVSIYGDGSAVSAGPGNDRIFSSRDRIKIYGDAGSDYIESQGNGNKIYGGVGNDLIIFGGSSAAFGGPGNDNMFEQPRDSDKYKVRIYGDDGDDLIQSADGRDFLFAGAGNDQVLNGQTMIKNYVSGNFTINIFKSSGRDEINCGTGKDYAQLEKRGKGISCEKKKYFPVTVKIRN